MNSTDHSLTRRIIGMIGGALVLLAPCMQASATVPDGLTRADWQEIHQQIATGREAPRYRAKAVENGFVAANPAHGFAIRYHADGATELTTPTGKEDSKGAAKHRIRLKPLALGYGDPDADHPGTAFGRPNGRTAAGETVTTHWNEQLREWWVNAPAGVEQWFELAAPPVERGEDGAPLVLGLALDSTLEVTSKGTGRAHHLRFVDADTDIRFRKLVVKDARSRRLPAHMRLQDRGRTGRELAYVIDDRNAVYPLTIDPTFVQQAYLKASNTGANDNLGRSVAVSGDTVVVGSPGEASGATGVNGNQADNSVTSAGAAYVFVRDGAGNWSQQAYLKASDPVSGAQFGWSVAISDNTIVVGAFVAGGSKTGAAYVFMRDGAGNWSQQARLMASNAEFDDQFGLSVAVSGDTVVVGANREDSSATGVNGNQADNSASEAGAAYVFVRDGAGNWSQQAYLKASNTGGGDGFSVVAVSGDTVVVGAPGEDSGATGVNGNQADNSVTAAGAAYVFVRDGAGVWTQQAYLKASNTGQTFENFGVSVAVSGDSVVVGAGSEDSSATGVNGNQADNSARGAGAAYVFVRDGAGNWSQQAYLKASNTGANDNFGVSVAVSGDSVVVGADSEASSATGVNGNQADNSASSAGAAYLFTRDGAGNWSQQAYLKASNTEGGDIFGISVAVSGDTAVVGALREDSNATGVNGDQADNSLAWAGAAYVFFNVPSFTIGGTVTGLAGSGLVLQNNGGDNLAISADGPFTFPTALADGSSYNVTVQTQPTGPGQLCTVANGTGTLNGANVTNVDVTCVTNQPPVAGDDAATTNEDAATTVDVAANDTDADGNLDPASANTGCGICTGATNGTLTNNGDGTFDYTPDADFFGADSFVYEICDTDGACDTASFDITVNPVNDPPSFVPGADPSLPAGTSGLQSTPGWVQSFDLGPNENQQIDGYAVTTTSDPDGILSATATIGNGGTLSFSLTGASGTAQLSATLSDDGGTANGGIDTSTPVGFTITVESPSADLSVGILRCTSKSAPGGSYPYGLLVVNNGPDAAEGVAVTHTPIPGATVNAISSPACVDMGDTIDCDLGTVSIGVNIVIGIDILAPNVVAQALTMSATVVADTDDPFPGGNTDQTTVEIVPGLVAADGFESCLPDQ